MEWRALLVLLWFLSPNHQEQVAAPILMSREHFYNRTLALHLVEYASAVYVDNPAALLTWSCSRCSGLTKGFKLSELIVDANFNLQAFVGVAENLAALVIAFRGTQETSLQNWMEDLYFREYSFNYPGVKDALVHHGFYSAYHNTTLRPRVLAAVTSVLDKRNDLRILITGHSLGGAMASLCALDLAVNFGTKDVQLITFGQPRIGNAAFAAYFNAFVPETIRVTHGHDIVPHLPPYFSLLGPRSYHHFAREVWLTELNFGILRLEFEFICDSSGEDPLCSRSVYGDSISDHMEYYGVHLGFVLESTYR
ncbi:hypothetical protein O6H91_07G057900 [Diphasiastrum complanatum]|uniref:Uncharacterized protein n=1 Tax=Diphasiastrum complanatum TaxID=34168 RepID=A0ACC2D5Y0_DIPCM|nr:hypothetical protein O6H91_07G057900 [Diphasiastrum complanatum]